MLSCASIHIACVLLSGSLHMLNTRDEIHYHVVSVENVPETLMFKEKF